MAKVTIQRQPAGYLFTQDGHEYFLMRPEPIPKDSWQLDDQQRWSVIRRISLTNYDENTDKYEMKQFPDGDTITIVTSNPTIEFCDIPAISVEIELIDEEDFVNDKLSEFELSEDDRQLKLNFDAVAPI